MERFEHRFHRPDQRSFDQAPAALRRRVFGVDYLQLRGKQSGDLFVTRHGWPVLESILPSHWFAGERLSKVGRRLAGATGAVYRVSVPHKRREQFALVVKFSRFAQKALVSIAPGEVMDWDERDRIAASEFLSPFEEFAHLERLRAAAGCRIPTKAPLAIYSPATRYLDWQLGRPPTAAGGTTGFSARTRPPNRRGRGCTMPGSVCIPSTRGFFGKQGASRARRGKARRRGVAVPTARRCNAVPACAGRAMRRKIRVCSVSILLYRWIDGIDAETAHQQGYLTEPELWQLSGDARRDLRGLGRDVLDHKPRHLIVRICPRSGDLVSRRRRTLWALVDYELLVPYPAATARPCARPPPPAAQADQSSRNEILSDP